MGAHSPGSGLRQTPTVAIIGGGASGILAAIHLLRLAEPPVIHVFNDQYEAVRGIAYSSDSGHLLLNVPACNMSAFADEPGDFYDWLQKTAPGQFSPGAFVPRTYFGDYLQATLRDVRNEAFGGRLHLHCRWVDHFSIQNGRFVFALEEGGLQADIVILATGNTPPSTVKLKNDAYLQDARYIGNSWNHDRVNALDKGARVLVLGSGLTAIDVVLQLRQQGNRQPIRLLSRHGKCPEPHRNFQPVELDALFPNLAGRPLLEVAREVRKRIRITQAHGGDWRQVVDGLRPSLNAIWSGWTTAERSRFLRHLRSHWDIHRHRMAPEIADTIAKERDDGFLKLLAGRIRSIKPEAGNLTVTYLPRAAVRAKTVQVDAVINCTGSEPYRCCSSQLLIAQLVEAGLAVIDPLALGLATTTEGALLNKSGQAHPNLYAIGPVRRGTLWETTAIREIRTQAADLAQSIAERIKGLKSGREIKSGTQARAVHPTFAPAP